MTETKLDEFDFATLSEALDALESKAMSDGFMGGMLGLMLSKDRDEAKEEFSKQMDNARKEGDAKKDQITLVRAKLIQMKREATVAEMGDVLRKGA